MASDTNLNKSGSTLSGAGSDLAGQASKAASEIQNRSAEVFSKLTDTAQQAAHQAKQQVSDSAATLASEANEQFSGLLKAQIGAGADVVDQVAQAARSVADDLDGKAPQLASMIRNAAHSAEEFSQDMRGRSISELVDMTSQYARRQPAIFVGAAVASGFLLARFVKSSSTAAPSQALRGTSNAGSSHSRPGSLGQVGADEFHDA
ncbi:MAG TPA: hypothetical protein VMU56_07545 [Beijerinckiaceae bacterium]|nr:hypothetical protein [Beijerinckiaceae bacterium]